MDSATYEQRKLALIEQITAAFDGVSREGGVSLHEAMVIDNYGDEAARAAARAEDTEARWQDVPDDDIRWSDAVLSFLDPIGVHYYMPAYMVWDLRNMDNEDPEFWSNTFDSIEYKLCALAYGNGDEEYFLGRFSYFTTSQRRVISRFVQFNAEHTARTNEESEQLLHQHLLVKGKTQKEIDEHRENVERYRIELGLPENAWQKALELYWGQFLMDEGR